jgi:GTP cyclohydrolase IV
MNRIGILGIEKLVEIKRPFGNVVLLPTIDVTLEIPQNETGDETENHVRLLENVNLAIDDEIKEKITSAENFCASILRKIISKSDIKGAEVKLEAGYVVFRKTPVSSLDTQEMYKILARAIIDKGEIKKMIGAEILGITTCPCAQEGLLEHVKELLEKKIGEKDARELLKELPIATHNQRNASTLLIEVPQEYDVEVEELIKILEGVMSSRLYEVLKRDDEIDVVLNAHKNPNFVEDVVRKILVKVSKKYAALPPESTVFVKSESFESIHQHNAVAERISTLGELREEVSTESF